ncbi:hypothetical protein F2Q70_00015103 [Brassica cretica]|uniref:Replication factor A C-terminal domain-containing protein n=1 Tax=Brassica cretica TaxID=69181 RepID=A0A8S9I3L0_BRACR|nr:hypothetical protein F2Q70_00015103 [Brassica cretica]
MRLMLLNALSTGSVWNSVSDQTGSAVLVAFDDELATITNIHASEAAYIMGVGVNVKVHLCQPLEVQMSLKLKLLGVDTQESAVAPSDDCSVSAFISGPFKLSLLCVKTTEKAKGRETRGKSAKKHTVHEAFTSTASNGNKRSRKKKNVSDIQRPWFQEQYRTLTLDTPLPRISNEAHQRATAARLARQQRQLIRATKRGKTPQDDPVNVPHVEQAQNHMPHPQRKKQRRTGLHSNFNRIVVSRFSVLGSYECEEYLIIADPQIIEFLCTAKVNEIHADKGSVWNSVSDQTGSAVLVAFDELATITNIHASEAAYIMGVGVNVQGGADVPQAKLLGVDTQGSAVAPSDDCSISAVSTKQQPDPEENGPKKACLE